MNIVKVRVTHFDIDVAGELYHLRFSTVPQHGQEAWTLVCQQLKKSYPHARWNKDYEWPDGRLGCWTVDATILIKYGCLFTNMDEVNRGESFCPPPRKSTSTEKSLVPIHIVTALTELGLSTPVTAEQAKKQFRSLVMLHHPDRGGRSEDFIKVKRAYDTVLKWVEFQTARTA